MGKIKLLLYCTKQPLYLVRNECDGYFYTMDKGTLNDYKNVETYNGKIVVECDFEVEEILAGNIDNQFDITLDDFKYNIKPQLDKLSPKNFGEVIGYAIHIKNLNIFDKPKELSECWANTNAWIFSNEKLYVAPQNMRYCGDWNLKKAILISIQPQWLCKILNGEKTIEVRKKVLKEMVK